MAAILVNIIQALSTIMVLVVIVDILVSYFLTPYHPVRSALDRVVNPILNPIRKLLPQLPLDFSPVILIIVIQVIEYLMVSLVIRVG